MPEQEGVGWGFILSAGRTGTVFLADALKRRFPDAEIEHEPGLSRYEAVLGNLRNRAGIGGGLLRCMFLASRRRRLRALRPGAAFVEINPLLCPLVDLVPEIGPSARIVHIVREPADWARSMITFKASWRFRPFIDWIPFADPRPHPWPAEWARGDKVVRALWRWRYCNERILALRGASAAYALIRYEDLFSPDGRGAALATLLATLALPSVADLDWFDAGVRLNVAPTAPRGREVTIDPAVVEAICGALRRELGYG